jgi:hypothetical protein
MEFFAQVGINTSIPSATFEIAAKNTNGDSLGFGALG